MAAATGARLYAPSMTPSTPYIELTDTLMASCRFSRFVHSDDPTTMSFIRRRVALRAESSSAAIAGRMPGRTDGRTNETMVRSLTSMSKRSASGMSGGGSVTSRMPR